MSSQTENQGQFCESIPEEDPYRVLARWTPRKSGLLMSGSASTVIDFAAPPRFGGAEGQWTPEDLLLGAIASCYTTTFCALAEYSKLKYLDLLVEVRGTLCKADRGYCFGDIAICPKLTIMDGDEQPRTFRLLQKAARTCLISRLLSVEPLFEPQVRVLGPQCNSVAADETQSRGTV
jgi:organic hydroperoxide reductase OsmC/OhrA